MRTTELTLEELTAVKNFSENIGIYDSEVFLSKFSLLSLEEVCGELEEYLNNEYRNAEEIMGITDAVNHVIDEQELSYEQISSDVWVKKKKPVNWVVLHNTFDGILKEIVARHKSKAEAEQWLMDLQEERNLSDEIMDRFEIQTEGAA